jgi:hypothetical protein
MEGLTPLEYMLAVLRDENADTERRDEMAKAAAPYIHPRLSSIEAQVAITGHEAALAGKQRGRVTRLGGDQRRIGTHPANYRMLPLVALGERAGDGDGGNDWPDQAGVFG